MRALAVFAAALLLHGGALAACPPSGATPALRAAKWEVADHAQRQAMALGMLDCLGNPDPALRDEGAFTALQTWMRGQQLDSVTLHALRAALLTMLRQADADGFAQPFAALVLAEVVRADRIKPFLDEAQRGEIVSAGTAYLRQLRDYRGYDDQQGWRHGVAHGADLMLQLALNPATDKAEQQAMLAAIRAQLRAPGTQGHFYHYGEGERLMAPVFHLARRTQLSEADWQAWFGSLALAPGATTQAALADRHHLKSFLLPLYVSLGETSDIALRARMLPIVTKALRQLD